MQHTIKEKIQWGILLTPSLFFVTIVIVIPMIGGISYSFTDWSGIGREINWIGLDNYRMLAKDSRFLFITFNTIRFAAVITVFQNVVGLVLALLVVKKIKFRNFFRAVFYMPAILSSLVVGYVWSFVYNPRVGLLNSTLELLGINMGSFDWLGTPSTVLYSVAAVAVWQFSGYSMLIYIVGLQSIPLELYEAADVEGANAWHVFKNITFPLIAPAFTINVILILTGTLKSFDHIFVMTNGGPGYFSEVLSTQLYKEAFTYNNMGYGSAISVVLFFMIAILTLTVLKYLRSRELN